MTASQLKTMKEGFLKGEDILTESLLQSIELGDSPSSLGNETEPYQSSVW